MLERRLSRILNPEWVPSDLDLPEPWQVVPHAAKALRSGGIYLSFVPTVPQVMKTVEALERETVFGMIGATFALMCVLYVYLSGLVAGGIAAALVMLIVGFFFATVSGQRLLYALSALTVAALKLGAPPLAISASLVAAIGTLDQAVGLDLGLVEQLTDNPAARMTAQEIAQRVQLAEQRSSNQTAVTAG